ncbi:hypothetical protein TNCV_4702661 [Trichonephila clavipes]|nr:hypothetical protein TNCV_4702661 [Trichonephila clavipes]
MDGVRGSFYGQRPGARWRKADLDPEPTDFSWTEWSGLHALGDPTRRIHSRRTSPTPSSAPSLAMVRQSVGLKRVTKCHCQQMCCSATHIDAELHYARRPWKKLINWDRSYSLTHQTHPI